MKTKRFTALLISILMILQMFVVAVAAEETTTSGTCGENVTWTLANGVLTISGTGPIKDFGYSEEKPWDTTAITSIVIKEGVTGIGTLAFANCTSLTSITLADSVTYLNYGAFNSCSALTDIKISKGIKSIDVGIFGELRSLENWVCDEDNEYFCVIDGVLYNKDQTKVISFPRGKTTQWTNIPDTLKTIGEYAFTYSKLTDTVTLPDTVTTIEPRAFIYSFDIPNVVFPDGLLTIGEKAFWNCFGLTTISIPASVTTIGEAAFGASPNISEIIVNENNQNYMSENGILFNKNKTMLYSYPSKKTDTSYTMPDSVTSLGISAFSNNAYLTSITLSANLTSISTSAFSQCTGLTSVTIPNGVTKIGQEAFVLCSGLESVTLPVSITSIDSYVFDRCTALQTVIFEGHAPTEWRWNIFNGISDFTINFYEHANGFTTPTWTAPDNVVYNTVMLPHEHHLPTHVEQVDSTCKNAGTAEHWACGCGVLFTNAAGTDETTLEELTLPVDSDKHGETEIRDAVAATEETDGYTGDTYCVDCNTKIAEGSTIKVIRGTCGENLTWTLVDGVLTISGTGPIKDFSWNEEKPWDESAVTSIVIGNGVTGIGEFAFSNCEFATSITIADTVTYIGGSAFDRCWDIQTIKLPNALESIDSGAFAGLHGLKNWECDDSNKNYCVIDGVLYNKEKTELISFPAGRGTMTEEIPETLTTIGESAFIYSSIYDSVTIPDTVTEIKSRAFIYSDISGVSFPEGLVTIGESAFWNCNQLTTVTIPENVQTIGDSAFTSSMKLTEILVHADNAHFASKDGVLFNKDYTELVLYPYAKTPVSYTVPEGVTNIRRKAFYNTSSLTSIVLPESLVNIEQEAFMECGNLASINIPKNVTGIGFFAFAFCRNLTSVTFEGPAPITWGGNLFDGASPDITIYCYEGNEGWTIPTWRAPNGAIYNIVMLDEDGNKVCAPDHPEIINRGNCGSNLSWMLDTNGCLTISGTGDMWWDPLGAVKSEIKSVVIEDGVTLIGGYAFADCPQLASVTIGKDVTTIGRSSFENCDALQQVFIPSTVKIIDEYAFANCNRLTSVTISNGVEMIRCSAFRECFALTEIVIPDSVTTIELYAFENCPALESVTLSNNLTVIRDSAFRTCTALKEIVIPDSVKTIEVCAFQGCSSLESVEIGDSVTFIGDAAFMECKALTSLTLGDSLEYIDVSAFRDCTALTKVVIPDSVTEIGIWAFAGCSVLERLELGDALTTIGDSAFRDCTALTEIIIPDSVTEIGIWAFAGCSALERLELGDALTKIGEFAFVDNVKLKAVVIPENVEEIGECAFIACTSMESLVFENCKPVVGNFAFEQCDSLQYVDLGNAVTDIGVAEFLSCRNLNAVYFGGAAPKSIAEAAFAQTAPDMKFYFYEGAEGWTSPIWVGPNGHGYATVALPVGTEIPVESEISDLESIPFVEADTIVVDGKKDAVYEDGADLLINNRVAHLATTGAIASASMMTNNGLVYLYVDVIDPQVVEPSPEIQANEPWVADSVEFLFHANNNVHQFRVDVADFLSYYRNHNGIIQAYGAEAEKYFVAHNVVPTENGYAIEFCIDTKMFGVSAGDTIGLQLQLNDMTAEGGRSCYNYRATDNAFIIENFDKVKIGIDEKYKGHLEMLGSNIGEVPYIKPGSIEIDGQYSSVWDNALKVEIDQFNYGDENASTRGTAYMYWTEGKWYLFVDVKDADVVTPDLEKQTSAPWVTDSVELFFDFAHEHSELVKQFRIDCSGYPSYYEEDGNIWAYGNDAKEYFDKYVVVKDADGYNIEMVVNLSKFGLTYGDEIGLQLQINDVASSNPAEVYSCWNMHQSKGAGSWDADLYDYVTLEAPEIIKVEIPVTENKDTISVEVKDAAVQGSTVTVNTVNTDALASVFDTPAIEPDDGEDSGDTETKPTTPANTVTIDVSNVKSEDSAEPEKVQQVTVPAAVVDTIKKAAESNNVEDAKLAVHLSTGSIIIDKTTMDVISKAAESEEGITTSLSLVIDDAEDNLNEVQETALENEVVFGKLALHMEVTKTDSAGVSETEKISDFGGGTVQLEIPFEIPEGYAESGFTVYYLEKDGTLTAMETQYSNGKITWTTGHFSDYIILYKEPPKEPIKINIDQIIADFSNDLRNHMINAGRDFCDTVVDVGSDVCKDVVEDVRSLFEKAGNCAINRVQKKIQDIKNSMNIDIESIKNSMNILIR